MHRIYILSLLVEIVLALITAGILLSLGYGIIFAVAITLVWLGIITFTIAVFQPQS